MKIIIERLENSRCWLFGKLTTDKNFECDTLEFGDDEQLESTFFDIKILFDRKKENQYISIFSKANQFKSVMVKHNSELYYNIELRIKNNYITIGTRKGIAEMKNQDGIYFKLQKIIEECEKNGETIELFIKNRLKSNE